MNEYYYLYILLNDKSSFDVVVAVSSPISPTSASSITYKNYKDLQLYYLQIGNLLNLLELLLLEFTIWLLLFLSIGANSCTSGSATVQNNGMVILLTRYEFHAEDRWNKTNNLPVLYLEIPNEEEVGFYVPDGIRTSDLL